MLEELNHYFIIFLEYGFYLGLFFLMNLFVYDRFIQRRHQLLINYPVIGRIRYLFEILRNPMRQYFGEETFYESRDKIDWVYKVAKDVPNFLFYSVSQPFHGSRIMVKHSNTVLNDDEVSNDFSVIFGKNRTGTQDPRRRASYLVVRKSHKIANYHKNLIKGIRTMLSVIGIAKVDMLSKENLTYKNNNGEIFFDIDKYFHHKLHI